MTRAPLQLAAQTNFPHGAWGLGVDRRGGGWLSQKRAIPVAPSLATRAPLLCVAAFLMRYTVGPPLRVLCAAPIIVASPTLPTPLLMQAVVSRHTRFLTGKSVL